jgi:hypothetical protein
MLASAGMLGVEEGHAQTLRLGDVPEAVNGRCLESGVLRPERGLWDTPARPSAQELQLVEAEVDTASASNPRGPRSRAPAHDGSRRSGHVLNRGQAVRDDQRRAVVQPPQRPLNVLLGLRVDARGCLV